MSTLVAQTISNGTVSTSSANVIQGSAKAWVNFSGAGSTSIRASYNVSSVTYTSTGNYLINFTNAFADTNYAPIGTSKYNSSFEGQNFRVGQSAYATDFTTTTLRVQTTNGGNSALGNSEFVAVAVFR
jgi:hypothetical protein